MGEKHGEHPDFGPFPGIFSCQNQWKKYGIIIEVRIGAEKNGLF
jgi:hypothetical protein